MAKKKKKMKFNPEDLIFPMTFVSVNTDKFEKEDGGIKKGDILFVAGDKAFPVSEEDPYTQRVFLYVQPVKEDHIDTSKGFYIIDPISVTNLPAEENERLLKILQEWADATIN